MRALAAACLALAIASAARADEPAPRIVSVKISGHLLESEERLASFLGLRVGDPLDAARIQRLAETVRLLGYLARTPVEPGAALKDVPGGVAVQLDLEPLRVVRHVDVHGNWPVFNDDVRRRLTLRPGSYLPLEAETQGRLAAESAQVRDYLHRDGWFWSDVDVVIRPGGRPDWVDLDVLCYLGPWTRLGDVQAAGARAITHGELVSKFQAPWYKPWWFGRFRLDQMRDDARDAEGLLRERGYPAARVLPAFEPSIDLNRKRRSSRVRLDVIEKARIDLHFIGNHALTDKQLREKLTLFAAGSYDEVELEQSARELHRFYQTRGFLEARVTFRRHRSTSDSLDVTFFVDEGRELKVRQVEIVPEPGAPPLTIEESLLRAQLATKVFPRIGLLGLGEGGYVTAEQLKLDERALEAYYRAQGYPEARVRGEIARDPGAFEQAGVIAADVGAGYGRGQDLYVRFAVDEGRKERIGRVEVRFHGAHGKSAADLVREIKLAPETPYTPAALDGARKRIIALYADHGHPYVSIDPTASGWNATHDRVDVVLTVDEGPEVRFGEILVRGHFKTLESVVLRDLPFRPGSLFSAEALDRARRNLQHHAIFNGVKVTPVGLASGINPVPVLVEIQERYDDWGTPVASVGLSTDIGFSESLGYFWGNVFGLGGSIELRGEVAESLDLSQFPTTATAYFDPHNPYWRLLALTLRYVHPHFILPSLRAELQGVLRKENTVRLGEVISEGFSLSISYVPSPSLRVFGRYDFTSAAQQNVDLQRLPGRSDYLVGVRDTTTTGKLTVGVVWDDRVSFDGAKNPLMPVDGWLLGLATSVAARPLGFELDHTHNFVVLSGQAQRYQPLGHDITLIVNLRGDWGVPIGESALPAVERFFAGGDTNTRGFDTDKLKTEVIRGDVSPAPGAIGFRIVPEGGNIRFLGTIELQFPIATLVGFPWVGALFFDAGSIFDDPRLIDPANDIKASVGLTLFRILTPVGPLSFEYAYPITQSLAEEQWKKEAWYLHWPGRIHFNWGIPIIR